jgi:hypothetical protein
MSLAEAESKTGSKILAEAIMNNIYSLLPTWGLILHNKVREPFHIGDWFIDVNEQTTDSPSRLLKSLELRLFQIIILWVKNFDLATQLQTDLYKQIFQSRLFPPYNA